MTVRAEQLFVFAGAGASVSMPAGLPAFDWLRDEILRQLGLGDYISGGGRATDDRADVAGGLAPEPFMLELSRAGVDVQGWLRDVLSAGRPNAAHHVIAQLASAGARVWTVNFDPLIEQASDNRLRCVAWPADPAGGAQLMKAHGSVEGQLIVTAEQVLAGLDGSWLERLRADVAGRTVVFLGYSGRDLDFQPVWDTVLAAATRVLWFDFWKDGEPAEASRRQLLLRGARARGALEFPLPAPPPPGLPATAADNPSWDFVAWCRDNGLADVDTDLARELFRPPPRVGYPPLPGAADWARPAVQGLLGDYSGARRSYLRLAMRPGGRRRAASAVVGSVVNHGGNGVARLLAPAAFLSRSGRTGGPGEMARRQRVAIWARTGRHDAVLRATRQLPPAAVSTYLILRSESLRITGSLDEAAAAADAARTQALREHHPVRVAHAAFQQCLALLWAERLDDLRSCLADDYEPYAAVAASRWVAWADFIAGGLAVRDRQADEAMARFALSEARFRAEALLDGVVSVMIARLGAHRLSGDTENYALEANSVERLSQRGLQQQRYYTRRNYFTAESIDIDRAEFARVHQRDLPAAWQLYQRAAASRYPLHAALGHLGLALIEAANGDQPSHAVTAADIAGRIGMRLTAGRARELLATPASEHAQREVFFC